MTRHKISTAPRYSGVLSVLALAYATAPAPSSAQDLMSPASPATAEACAALSADVERLACYDNVFARQGEDTTARADLDAERAREIRAAKLEQELDDAAGATTSERARIAAARLFSTDARIANAGKGGLLDSRWELARDSKLGIFNLRAYKPLYLLPVVWSSSPNKHPTSSDPNIPAQAVSMKSVEAKFQVSFKTKAVENLFGDNGDVWMGYSQTSHWQVYNGDDSRPFRESNYEPEVMLVFRNNYRLGDSHLRMIGIGVNHQSNGRADPLSRSWNRVVMNVGLDRENWALTVRPWWRITEGGDDDNPGIENYLGRADATLVHTRDGHEFALMARHSLRSGSNSRGALQFDWGFPLTRTLRGHLLVFDGYGESLIDYDHRSTQIGMGISLQEWF